MNVKTLLTSAFMLAIVPGAVVSAVAQTPMSEADCTALMTKADKNSDGTLDTTEAKVFNDKIAGSDTGTTGAAMTKDQYMAECTKGTFTGVTVQ